MAPQSTACTLSSLGCKVTAPSQPVSSEPLSSDTILCPTRAGSAWSQGRLPCLAPHKFAHSYRSLTHPRRSTRSRRATPTPLAPFPPLAGTTARHFGTQTRTGVCTSDGFLTRRSVTASRVVRLHTLLIPVVVVRRPAHVRQHRAEVGATPRRRSRGATARRVSDPQL